MSKKKVTLARANFMGFRVSPIETIYGQPIVEEQLTNAFLSYSDNKYQYMCIPGSFDEMAINRINRKKKCNKIQAINMIDIINNKEKYQTDIFHSINNFKDMVFIREKCFEHISPISFTLHCASKPSSILNDYLMMLLLPFRSYDSFICTSQSSKSAVERQINLMAEKLNHMYGGGFSYKGRFDVIPLGVDTDVFRPYNKKDMRNKYGIAQNDFVILWLGRFSCFDKADLIQLLRVVKKLTTKNKDKNITLLMVGSDSNIYPYIRDIEKNAQILGIDKNIKIISDYEIYKRHELYSVADVFTSPIDNIQETFGITPIEAMSCGVPQVVSDWDGYKESVVHGVTGFRVPTTWYQYNQGIYDIPRGAGLHLKEDYIYSHYLTAQSIVLDENAYIQAFQTLIDNSELLNKMATDSRALAVKKYDWKHIISCYNLLWDEMLEQSKNKNDRIATDNQRLDVLRINPYEIFETYPTQICNRDIILSLTEEGKQLFEEKKGLLSNTLLDGIFIKHDAYQTVLRILSQKNRINFSLLIKEASNYYSSETVINCTTALIKRGYIAVI